MVEHKIPSDVFFRVLLSEIMRMLYKADDPNCPAYVTFAIEGAMVLPLPLAFPSLCKSVPVRLGAQEVTLYGPTMLELLQFHRQSGEKRRDVEKQLVAALRDQVGTQDDSTQQHGRLSDLPRTERELTITLLRELIVLNIALFILRRYVHDNNITADPRQMESEAFRRSFELQTDLVLLLDYMRLNCAHLDAYNEEPEGTAFAGLTRFIGGLVGPL